MWEFYFTVLALFYLSILNDSLNIILFVSQKWEKQETGKSKEKKKKKINLPHNIVLIMFLLTVETVLPPSSKESGLGTV